MRELFFRVCGCSAGVALTLITACQTEGSWSGSGGTADRALFDAEVYPVLLRDCAYSNCHGAQQRYLQILGPGRSRMDDRAGNRAIPLNDRERELSYARALSMLITDGSRPINESPLLVKPLEASVGGAAHGGVDVFGRNVYRSINDPGYVVLWRWALSGNPNVAAAPAAGASAAP